jgi:hypothetical protein
MVAAVLLTCLTWFLTWFTCAYHALAGGRSTVRWLAAHTGLPALLVAALLVVLGWRVLRKTARFAVEVAVVTAALFAATELGWIQW